MRRFFDAVCIPATTWLTNITVHREFSIFFCWVHGHIGIPGQEQVDNLAKLAVNLDTSEESMFFKDWKPSIKKHLRNNSIAMVFQNFLEKHQKQIL